MLHSTIFWEKDPEATITCLVTPLQHKSQRKLYEAKSTVEFDNIFCDDCRDFWKPLQVGKTL